MEFPIWQLDMRLAYIQVGGKAARAALPHGHPRAARSGAEAKRKAQTKSTDTTPQIDTTAYFLPKCRNAGRAGRRRYSACPRPAFRLRSSFSVFRPAITLFSIPFRQFRDRFFAHAADIFPLFPTRKIVEEQQFLPVLSHRKYHILFRNIRDKILV